MGIDKTIHEMLFEVDDNFPKSIEERNEVENVIQEIKLYIENNKYRVWGNANGFPQNGDCIGIEIVPNIFNGYNIPEGEKIFYLLRNEDDESYFDYFKRRPLRFYQTVSKYNFNKSQDRYFEYLMAKEGLVRRIKKGSFFPSEARWYLL